MNNDTRQAIMKYSKEDIVSAFLYCALFREDELLRTLREIELDRLMARSRELNSNPYEAITDARSYGVFAARQREFDKIHRRITKLLEQM